MMSEAAPRLGSVHTPGQYCQGGCKRATRSLGQNAFDAARLERTLTEQAAVPQARGNGAPRASEHLSDYEEGRFWPTFADNTRNTVGPETAAEDEMAGAARRLRGPGGCREDDLAGLRCGRMQVVPPRS